jgi:predicted  nucleic acid-binding Zn-ribbon protein
MSAVENIHPLPLREDPAAVSAKNIIVMLQQAADVAKRNEDRAKAQAVHWHQQCHDREARIEQLEDALDAAEKRATTAEQWIDRIYMSVKESLLDPLVVRSQSHSS